MFSSAKESSSMVMMTTGAVGGRGPRRANCPLTALSSLLVRKPEMSYTSAREAASPKRLPAMMARQGKEARLTARLPYHVVSMAATHRIDSKFRLPNGASWIRSHGYPCSGGGHRDTSERAGVRDATAGTIRARGPEAEADPPE